jgi:hypothetical protein
MYCLSNMMYQREVYPLYYCIVLLRFVLQNVALKLLVYMSRVPRSCNRNNGLCQSVGAVSLSTPPRHTRGTAVINATLPFYNLEGGWGTSGPTDNTWWVTQPVWPPGEDRSRALKGIHVPGMSSPQISPDCAIPALVFVLFNPA